MDMTRLSRLGGAATITVLMLTGSAVVWAQQHEVSAADVERWRAIARDRFLEGDVKGALDALNVIGEPRVDQVHVEGLVRTRRDVVKTYLGLRPGDRLTAPRLTRLERRLDEFPIASTARIRYDAVDGRASVRPIVFERNLVPFAPADLIGLGARALFTQEVRLLVSDPMGRGDLWTPAYRWAANRPRVTLGLAIPAPGALPGLARLEATWQRETYRGSTLPGGLLSEERIRVGTGLSDWLASWLRWYGDIGLERINQSTYAGFALGFDSRFSDHVSLRLNGGQWHSAHRSRDVFRTGDLTLMVRSTTKRDVPTITAVGGVARASDSAPLAMWPGAGASHGRGILLRAHALHVNGVTRSEQLGRDIAFGGIEYAHPVSTRFGFVDLATFVDAARVRSRLNSRSSTPLDVDIGTGLRFNISRAGNKVRLDLGYGLRDGRVEVSADYVQPWGAH